MKDFETKEQKIWNILQVLYQFFSVLVLVDIKEKTYERLGASGEFEDMIPEQGDVITLHKALFLEGERDGAANKYDTFAIGNMFERANYNGRLTMEKDGQTKEYNYFVIRISEEQSALIVSPRPNQDEAEMNEQEKMNAIRDNYLFSMLVDLKADSCINSATAEIRAERQDYLQLTYSQWRKMISEMFLPEDRAMFFEMSEPSYIMERLQQERLFKFEIQMLNMAGQYIWVRLMFCRTKNFSTENPVFVYSVEDINEDMSRLLQQENIIAAVEKKNQELMDMNREKTMFISNISHEIRTPINAILGMDEVILRESTEEDIKEYAYNIRSASKMLLSIINDVLDYSKIESGRMEIIPVEYDVISMLDDICNIIEIRLQEKNLGFRIKVDPNMPKRLYGDELRLKQVIINILTNAVKYTEEGGIRFLVEAVSPTEDTVGFKVTVIDTGIGMKEEEIPRLFEAFSRLDERRNREIEGTGLGMSIVFRLLEQMDSKLDVQSEYGVGSTFSFTVEQKIVSKEPVGNYKKARRAQGEQEEEETAMFYAPDAKVLVVDDNIVNHKVIQLLLKRTGICPDTAHNGEECLQQLKNRDYDIVLLDYLMPGMDGVETLNEIRKMGEAYQELPVIAMTANSMSGAREMYLNAGFVDYLEKPLNGKMMEEMLLQYLPPESVSKRF
ncbi:MAG: ATP-binding protein [Eubacteriales bacterium]|nr:ATP-binding protein [Eubacteriales bacterium]